MLCSTLKFLSFVSSRRLALGLPVRDPVLSKLSDLELMIWSWQQQWQRDREGRPGGSGSRPKAPSPAKNSGNTYARWNAQMLTLILKYNDPLYCQLAFNNLHQQQACEETRTISTSNFKLTSSKTVGSFECTFQNKLNTFGKIVDIFSDQIET